MDREKRWEDLFDEQTLSSIFEGLLLLGTAGIAYKEHQRAKAEQQRHNEELKELLEKVTAMQAEQLRQTKCMEDERRCWEEEKTSLEAEMAELRSSLENKQKDYETLRARLADKEQAVNSAKQELASTQESYQKERNETKQRHSEELNALEEKNRATLDSARQQQEAALERLKLEHESEKEQIRREDTEALEKAVEEYQEIHEDWDLYHRYKAWFQENISKIRLNGLECGSFAGFIGCCSQVDTLHYIYQELESQNLWNWDQQDVDMMEEVIKCCCKLQNLDRLKPEDFYNPACHHKPEDGPSSGYVGRVLLAGVEKNGVMLEDCKSFIEIAPN